MAPIDQKTKERAINSTCINWLRVRCLPVHFLSLNKLMQFTQICNFSLTAIGGSPPARGQYEMSNVRGTKNAINMYRSVFFISELTTHYNNLIINLGASYIIIAYILRDKQISK